MNTGWAVLREMDRMKIIYLLLPLLLPIFSRKKKYAKFSANCPIGPMGEKLCSITDALET